MVEVSRIQAGLDRHGAVFAERFCTPHEIAYCKTAQGKWKISSLAACFAAKEALAKALGYGLSHGVSLQEIEVRHTDQGNPYYELYGRTARVFQEEGFEESSLSISHDGNYAIAFCTLFTRGHKKTAD